MKIPLEILATVALFLRSSEAFVPASSLPSSVGSSAHDVLHQSSCLIPSHSNSSERQRPLSLLSATLSSSAFDEKQKDFTIGYLNKHHGDLLTSFAIAFTELGAEMTKRNRFSGGSFKILDATLVDVSADSITLDVTVKDREKKDPSVERVECSLDATVVKGAPGGFKDLPLVPPAKEGTASSIDQFVRRMNRLCAIVKQPAVTGKLIQLGLQIQPEGNRVGEVKENMFLNQVPHNRFVRQYFYDMAAEAALEAVIACSEGKISNRMKIQMMFPEMNPGMDSYRIGTLLELTRQVAIHLVEQNLRVRVCVQGSMGVGIFTGTPKQFNGVATLLQRMDWQAGEGEENEGILGDYIRFGAIGKDHVMNEHTDRDGNKIEQDDVFLLICPQNMVGLESSIIPYMQEMVEAAGDRPVILINPDLTDKVSSQGQQSVRGRQERLDFADSFVPIYEFSNIYVSGTSYFPILGSIFKKSISAPWVAHQRRDLTNGDERYIPILCTEERPDGELIMDTFDI